MKDYITQLVLHKRCLTRKDWMLSLIAALLLIAVMAIYWYHELYRRNQRMLAELTME